MRIRGAGIALAAACAHVAVAAPGPVAVPAPALADDVADPDFVALIGAGTHRFARPTAHTSLHATREGGAMPLASSAIWQSSWDAWTVVAEEPGIVRVIVRVDGARLLAWSPTDELADVIVRDSSLAASPTARVPAAGAIGVFVGVGLMPAIGASSAGRREIDLHDGQLTVHGWIPDSAIGKVYAPSIVRGDPDPAPPGRRWRPITFGGDEGAPPVDVLDAPGGNVIATLAGSRGWGRAAGRHTTEVVVRVDFWPLIVHGFIAAPVEAIDHGYGWGTIGVGGLGSAARDPDEVAPGSCLYSEHGGARVGVLDRAGRTASFDRAGWAAVVLQQGNHDVLTLWVHRDAARRFDRCAAPTP
jgi:hypothetical protein